MRILALLFCLTAFVSATNYVAYNKNYEPWASLYQEGEQLTEYLDIEGLLEAEQKPLRSDEPMLTFKLVVEGVNMTQDDDGIDSMNETAKQLVETELQRVVTNSNITMIKSLHFHTIRKFRSTNFPLVYGHMMIEDNQKSIKLQDYLQELLEAEEMNGIHRGQFVSVKPTEPDSVIQIVIQLLGEPWPYSMKDEKSDYRLNYTDVMLHLIEPKFQSIFGEHYYRTVITWMDNTAESVIISAHILLDPDKDNLYHASKIWFTEYGYVNFGRWKLFPSNLQVVRCTVVPLRFHEWLSDRSYLAPQSPEFMDKSPILTVTLPAFAGLALGIICILCCLSFMHHMAFGSRKDRYKVRVDDCLVEDNYDDFYD